MLLFYLFLYVFSLSIPVFYHSAFLAGFCTLIHLVFRYKTINFTLTRYQVGYCVFFILGYCLILFVVVLNDTYDLSYFKTYSNSFLSALCGIPLALLYFKKYQDNASVLIMKDIFIVFLIQSIIILVVLFFPPLKNIVSYFHRDPDIVNQADLFSNGLRTNALSGGLFFGLSISFGLAIIIYVYQYFIINNKWKVSSFIFLIISNIGLMCTGRFGFIYIICLMPMLIASSFVKKMKILIYCIIMIILISVFFIFLINSIPFISEVFYGKIYPYMFEFMDNYINVGTIETASTNQLSSMYNISTSTSTWFFGDGLYTGNDEAYYQHTDVGFLRLFLLGGVGLCVYFFVFTWFTISPLRRLNMPYNKSLFYSVLLLLILSQLKGEAMVTMVQLNNILFLLCSIISLTQGFRRR